MKRDMQRLARIETEARVLARSGEYRSSNSIERALLARGFGEARKRFANKWTQTEVDRLCEQAALRADGSLQPVAAYLEKPKELTVFKPGQNNYF